MYHIYIFIYFVLSFLCTAVHTAYVSMCAAFKYPYSNSKKKKKRLLLVVVVTLNFVYNRLLIAQSVVEYVNSYKSNMRAMLRLKTKLYVKRSKLKTKKYSLVNKKNRTSSVLLFTRTNNTLPFQ